MEYINFTQDKIPEVVDLFMQAFNNSSWGDSWTPETVTKRLMQMTGRPCDDGLICKKDGKPVGLILGTEEQYDKEIHFTIKEFCTHPDFKGQGIGKNLLAAFEKRLKEKGIDKTFLMTIEGEGTVGVYEKFGYVISDGMVMMEKKL